jgi:type VI secretion system protein ImpM
MQCAMFGKLPSKRDFVSYNMPRPFLDQWEAWLQRAVASSRAQMGQAWQDAFLTAPIWRFWLGSKVLGQAVTGALMSSVDGIGRYFPLSILACETAGVSLLPPPARELTVWHEECEALLLQLLEDQLPEEPAALLAKLPFAPTLAQPASRLVPQGQNTLVWTGVNGSLAPVYAEMETRNREALHSQRSYWWTQGGPAHQAQMVTFQGPADDQFLASLLTGDFRP